MLIAGDDERSLLTGLVDTGRRAVLVVIVVTFSLSVAGGVMLKTNRLMCYKGAKRPCIPSYVICR